MKNFFELLKNDFWKNNAILVQMLGLCPTLAVTSSAVNALGLMSSEKLFFPRLEFRFMYC